MPGARELLRYLTERGVPWTIATSGRIEERRPALDVLGVGQDAGGDPGSGASRQARIRTCSWRLRSASGVDIGTPSWSGDSIWDLLAARRAGALGVGLLAGGYGQEELQSAGAYRVYEDPADLLAHLDEVGVRRSE